jgi:hypothetical protein
MKKTKGAGQPLEKPDVGEKSFLFCTAPNTLVCTFEVGNIYLA